MSRIAIIGAGVAGLAAGRKLARAGYGVTLFEKSRGLGGRVTTRRVEGGFAVDHGAQLMKAPTPALQALVAEVPGAEPIDGPVWVFAGDGPPRPGDPAQNAEPQWTWPGGIAALGRYLGQNLDVRRETTVAGLAGEQGAYRVRSDAGEEGPFEAVILTPPAPQSAAILAASAIDQAACDALLAALKPVRYRACLSVALAYQRRPEVPWYALVSADRAHPVAWLACEHVKPGRAPEGAGLLLAQMSPAWTELHWEALPKGTYAPGQGFPDAALAVHRLLHSLAGDLGAPLWADAHRWRYALCDAPCEPAAAAGVAGILVAGDVVAGQGRVHRAIESGWEAAERVAAMLR
jgi:renalase